ncbi:Transcription-repair-coupling factor [Buchnera aphidicola (Thelaxes suberi)]|uniref:transcription-repair coupling factor n=1 Tax=Buchnera aphidicola TaxID=9 RepID=UPI003463C47F
MKISINLLKNNKNINKMNEKNIINNTYEIKKNDFLVHIEHGIGKYKGLKKININNIKNEYLIIEYANKVKLFVPIYYMHLVQKYSFNKHITPIIHNLGNNNWSQEYKKITEKIHDSAILLLRTYANRAASTGFSFKNNLNEYDKFIKDCPFKTTKNQDNVILSVLSDMKKIIPMDRIICGDVGVGKTEIAIRAAFVSLLNKKQVAILVPTTLLAQQHFHNFKIRFKKFKYKIEYLSRFKTKEEEKKILLETKKGIIHLLIGTHKILLKKVQWNNLGLLIIDEEHRFGVMHKEYIKKNNHNIDILTLTATPIPRTLNMAICGIRDLSIINTPPDNRLPIKTFVKEYNLQLIKKVISKEISRGGQVYYVFNKVKKIKKIVKKLSDLLPNIRIYIGHGQMKAAELKTIMCNFYKKKFDVLVSTTIIETGIDMPNVNSIIIEEADQFGLSQLHQLRGRVGRSNCQAYAWLLIKNLKNINANAIKRLSAITSMQNLGSGFLLSHHDLEIRGIGELLGEDQSGHINAIGINLYTKLLNEAIQIIKNNNNLCIANALQLPPKIELNVVAIIPSNYIKETYIRVSLYNKLANTNEIEELEQTQKELLLNFGKLPNSTHNLILINKIRIMSKMLGIQKIKSTKKGGEIIISEKNSIKLEVLFPIVEKNVTVWKIKNKNSIQYSHLINDNLIRIRWLLNFISEIFEYSLH